MDSTFHSFDSRGLMSLQGERTKRIAEHRVESERLTWQERHGIIAFYNLGLISPIIFGNAFI